MDVAQLADLVADQLGQGGVGERGDRALRRGALRITGLGPNQGHVININLAYAPSDATQAAITEHTATELSGAVFEISPDGSEVTERYQRLLGEIASAERKIAEIDDKIRELAAQQDAANVEAKPGLGKRLVRIGKKISALKKQRDDVAYEADLLGDVAARSRADTERALGTAFARQQMLALGCFRRGGQRWNKSFSPLSAAS